MTYVIIQQIDCITQKKNGYDIEKKERRRIKKFLTTLMTIGGILNKELCEELEIEDELEEDEEDRTNKKFDNATKEKLHQRSIHWRKVNGKIENIK